MSNVSASGNYPLMSRSEWDKAPFNYKDNDSQEIEVTISVTMSKTVKVKVSDYYSTPLFDEDGNVHFDYDFSQCNLKAAVKEQITLPFNAYNSLSNVVLLSEDNKSIKALNDLKDWSVDDYEVIPE